MKSYQLSLAAIVVVFFAAIATASPYATSVVTYTAGSDVGTGYDQPTSALGEPTRSYSDSWGNYNITPFSSPYLPEHIVSIGPGGSLVVAFDHAVIDDPDNPYGIDLLIFGNAFFVDIDVNYNGLAGDINSDPAKIAVSQDGTTWINIKSVLADDLYPTMGYQNTTGPYNSDGTVESDFTKPVDPAFNPVGKTYAQIVAGYKGSGGGTGIDLAETGLSWIQYVKIYLDTSATYTAEIDGFADVTPVPEPITLLTFLIGLPAAILNRKSR